MPPFRNQLSNADNPSCLIYMVSQGRFELPTFPLGGGCSIQLSYWDTIRPRRKRSAMDGVHVNGRAGFCHVVRWAF